MRLSTIEADPGYVTFLKTRKCGRARVMLNGVEVKNAVTVDEEECLVVRHKRDADGKWTVDPWNEVKTETLRGHVRVYFDEVRD